MWPPAKTHDMGRPLKLRHFAICGKETTIEITPRRGRCSYCNDRRTTA